MNSIVRPSVGPTFLGIGAQKAGTSWLALALSKHPQIFITPKKEVHYFDCDPKYPSPCVCNAGSLVGRLIGRDPGGVDWRESITSFYKKEGRRGFSAWWKKYYFSRYSDGWYLSLFDSNMPQRGEITPAYSLLDQTDVQRVRDVVGDVRVLLILRDPAERDWSQFRFHCDLGGIDPGQLKEDEIRKYLALPEVTERSNYAAMFDRWTSVFGDQVGVFCFEDIKEAPDRFLSKILLFLGVEIPTSVELGKMIPVKPVNKSCALNMPDSIRAELTARHGTAHRIWTQSRTG